MEKITRSEALAKGLTRFFQGRVCVAGHVSEQYVKGGRCVTCAIEKSKEQSKLGKKAPGKYNPEQKADYYNRNKDRIKEKRLAEAASKIGLTLDQYVSKIEAKKAAASTKNGKRTKEQSARYSRSYYIKSKAKIIAANKAKKAAKLKRVPPWANTAEIMSFYKLAQHLTATTGIEHHVDHIIPLAGLNVSGLHCQHNLRVITATENLTKGNRFDQETYVHQIP